MDKINPMIWIPERDSRRNSHPITAIKAGAAAVNHEAWEALVQSIPNP